VRGRIDGDAGGARRAHAGVHARVRAVAVTPVLRGGHMELLRAVYTSALAANALSAIHVLHEQ